MVSRGGFMGCLRPRKESLASTLGFTGVKGSFYGTPNRVLDPQRKKAIYSSDTTSIYAVFSMFKGNSQNIYLSIYGFRLRPKELKQLFFGAPEVWQLLCICTYTAPLTFI